MKKHTIWSSEINLDDWRDDLISEDPDLTETELYERADEINAWYLNDERASLDIKLDDFIIVIADLGLWYGRRRGYREIRTANVSACLYPCLDQSGIEWYVDERKDLCARESHHDGTNYYLYRVWRPETTEWQRQNFMGKIYDGTVTRKDINRYTRRLGDKVAEVYGW